MGAMKLLIFVFMFYGPLFVRNQSTDMPSLEELHARIDQLEEQVERLMRVSPVWRININRECPASLDKSGQWNCFPVNARCYCVCKTRKNFLEAGAACRQYAMKLVSLDDPNEKKALLQVLKSKVLLDQYLTSGLYSNETGQWTWTTSGKILQITEKDWFTGEPNRWRHKVEVEHCIEWVTTKDALFNDIGCHNFRRQFICQSP